MTGFILDYSTEQHGHVEWDQRLDIVKYWGPSFGLPSYEGPMEGFALEYPDIMREMRKNRIIRVKP